MSDKKSLADLLGEADKPVEWTYTAVVGKGLEYVAQIDELNDQLQDAALASLSQVDEDGERKGPPRKAGQRRESAEVTAIKRRMAEAAEAMAAYEGTLTIHKARTDGEWRRWCNEHPARTDGQEHQRDIEVAGFRSNGVEMAFCDADALLDDLASYVVAWEGEPLAEGQFDKLGIGLADKKAIAKSIVAKYELEGPNLGKWRRGLSATLGSGQSSSSPEPSESVNGDSTAGNPESSTSTSTTTQDALPVS